VRSWNDYATAKQYAPLIVQRLEGDGIPSMPPTTTEILNADQIQLVITWVNDGLAP
jgi:hypothetical protein